MTGLATLALTMAVCAPALAQNPAADYPSRPVTIVIPSPPGATSDRDARIWVQKLTAAFGGKPFVLDFKAGAGSIIGTNFVAKAAPDGHTLLNITSSYPVLAATHKDLPFDPGRDLTPVSLMLRRPTMLAVHPSMPVNNFAEFVAYAKANPGKVNFGTAGAGSISHIVGAWLQSGTNTKVTFVHYKGAAPNQTDLMAGRTQVSTMSLSVGVPFVKAGKLRAIAILSPERSRMLPGLKTVDEQGIPGFNYSTLTAILAPSATPAPIINKLSAEFAKITKAPDVIKTAALDGTVLVGSTPAAAKQYLDTEIARWRKLVYENDIQGEQF
jgi:tripartite-type tricarboxylate transporter receptor subunit TctC